MARPKRGPFTDFRVEEFCLLCVQGKTIHEAATRAGIDIALAKKVHASKEGRRRMGELRLQLTGPEAPTPNWLADMRRKIAIDALEDAHDADYKDKSALYRVALNALEALEDKGEGAGGGAAVIPLPSTPHELRAALRARLSAGNSAPPITGILEPKRDEAPA